MQDVILQTGHFIKFYSLLQNRSNSMNSCYNNNTGAIYHCVTIALVCALLFNIT